MLILTFHLHVNLVYTPFLPTPKDCQVCSLQGLIHLKKYICTCKQAYFIIIIAFRDGVTPSQGGIIPLQSASLEFPLFFGILWSFSGYCFHLLLSLCTATCLIASLGYFRLIIFNSWCCYSTWGLRKFILHVFTNCHIFPIWLYTLMMESQIGIILQCGDQISSSSTW